MPGDPGGNAWVGKEVAQLLSSQLKTLYDECEW